MKTAKIIKYLEVAHAVSKLSKDESTKVGAVILGKDSMEIRSLGYNGAPRGCAADEDEGRTVRPEKYFWFEHAERNAIFNAARIGTPLAGSTLIVTHPPCMDCARAIVQAGIREVFWPKPDPEFGKRWIEHKFRVIRLFNECGINFDEIDMTEKPVPLGPLFTPTEELFK